MLSRMQKLTIWEKAVARPAPAVPMWKTKISNGSQTRFSTAPVTSPIMAFMASPSKRRMLLRTKLPVMKGAPSRMKPQ